MHTHPQSTSGPFRIDIWAIGAILRRRLWLVALTTFTLAGLTAAYTLIVSPVYQASTQLLIDPTMRQPFDNPNLPSRAGNGTTLVDSQVALIASDTVLRPVALEFALKDDPEFAGKSTARLFFSALASAIGVNRANRETSDRERENAAVQALSKVLHVERKAQTTVVGISVDSEDPDKAAKLAQAVAESFLADQKKQKEASSLKVTDQIDQRLSGLRRKLRKAELAVQDFKAENGLQSTGENGLLTSQELGGLSTQLTDARAAVAEKQARYRQIATVLKKGVSPDSIDTISTSQTVSRLRDQFTEAVRQEANLEADLLPSHPALIRAKSQVARIEGLLRAEAKRIADAARIDLAVARQRVANLERAVGVSRSKVNVGNNAQIRLRELETEAQTTRTLYETILGRAKEIAALDQVVVPDARIIAPAITGQSPIWPKRKLMVALAALLGLLLGTGFAIGGEALRQVSAQIPVRPADGPYLATATPLTGAVAIETRPVVDDADIDERDEETRTVPGDIPRLRHAPGEDRETAVAVIDALDHYYAAIDARR